MDDPTARTAELAELIEKQLIEDEAWAKTALETSGTGEWQPGPGFTVIDSREVCLRATDGATAIHAARQNPARTLRRVKAARDLVAEILAEGHHYDESDYYCCSQAREAIYDGWTQTGEGPPGSACSDPERSGKPCDCGRDARVARRLGIIASEREG